MSFRKHPNYALISFLWASLQLAHVDTPKSTGYDSTYTKTGLPFYTHTKCTVWLDIHLVNKLESYEKKLTKIFRRKWIWKIFTLKRRNSLTPLAGPAGRFSVHSWDWSLCVRCTQLVLSPEHCRRFQRFLFLSLKDFPMWSDEQVKISNEISDNDNCWMDHSKAIKSN